jgi:hypothetical protein
MRKEQHHSEITKQKMRDSHRKLVGEKNPFYGHHHSKETRIKIGNSNRGKKQSKETKIKMGYSKLGDKNPLWKGNAVSYNALHTWIHKNKPKPELCEQCKKKPPYEIANISGKYRRDINDYRWLCRKCHMLEDGRMNNLKHQNGIK